MRWQGHRSHFGKACRVSECPDWWRRPRRVSVVVDNPSWILFYAEVLVGILREKGDETKLVRNFDEMVNGDVAFFLGCVSIALPDVLSRNRRNLVVHESNLPAGRGFSPLTWQILQGESSIPICLLDAADGADTGPVVYRAELRFEGHELIDELREKQGRTTVELCCRFLDEARPLAGVPQQGTARSFARRHPRDSRLNAELSLAQQFDLLRVVNNDRYPAFFEMRGHRYTLRIDKAGAEDDGN